MKQRVSDSFAIASWFHYLQMAIRAGLPISKRYDAWGTREEIAATKFAVWWRERGETLFRAKTSEVVVSAEDEESVTLVIPRGLPANEALAKVRVALSGKVGKQFQRSEDEFAYSSRVHYAKLRQYERLLAIRLGSTGIKTLLELGEEMRREYQRIADKSLNRAVALKKSNNRIWRRVSWTDPQSFRKVTAEEVLEKTPRSTKRQVSDLSEKVLRLWIASGFITLLNVAEGQFPGPQSTGKRVAESVKTRLRKIGREDLWTGQRNKGGGRTKAQLTQVQQRWTKQEQRQRAQRALRESTGIKGTRLDIGHTTPMLTREQMIKVDLAKIEARRRGVKK
jgi:hypothetical protein